MILQFIFNSENTAYMKKITLLKAIIACTLLQANAQDPTVRELQKEANKEIKGLDSNGWRKEGVFILNLNQGALSNWAAGGESSVFGINGIFNFAFNYRHERHSWDNQFDFTLGFQNATSFGKFRKIDDRIDITSKYGYNISEKWSAGLLVNFNSQVLAGYDYSTDSILKISSFLSPGKLLASPGFDYKPGKDFSVFISPASVRWVFKKDDDFFSVSKFGVDSAKTVNVEIGAYLTAKYRVDITSWASYTGRLDLFSNYRRNPGNIDVLMNNLLSMKFTKSLATNISLDLIYDHDIRRRLQLKEILGVGLTVKL